LKEVKAMHVGYSTHGCWASLERIKQLEVEDRGNPWFDDEGMDLESWEGIWVTLDPQKAIWYLFPAENFEAEPIRCIKNVVYRSINN
jgi:hypothetical protein